MIREIMISIVKTIFASSALRHSKHKISYESVRKGLLKSCLQERMFISDMDFLVPEKEDMEKLVVSFPLKHRQYAKESFDCDDFSKAFVGLCGLIIPDIAVGIVWNKHHAYNFVICSDGKIYGIEPQEGRMFSFTDKKSEVQLMVI